MNPKPEVEQGSCLDNLNDVILKGDKVPTTKSRPRNGERFVIGLSLEGKDHPFMQAIVHQVTDCTKKWGWEMLVTDGGGSAERQAGGIRQMLASGIDLLMVEAAEADPLKPALEDAHAQGVPFMFVGKPIKGTNAFSIVAPDSYDIGRQIGSWIVGQIRAQHNEPKGQIVVLEGIPGDETSMERVGGVLAILKDYPDIKVIAQCPANYRRAQAMTVVGDILRSHPDPIDGIFAANGEMALGAAAAARNANRQGESWIVGIDCSAEELSAIKAEEQTASWAYRPGGREGALVAKSYLDGEGYYPLVVLPTYMIDQSNIATAEPAWGDLALELRGISKRFPGVQALSGVTFTCRKGEVHALVGENGAGKSTLIKVLSGAHQPDGGEIILNGNRVTIRSPYDALQLGIGVIYQEFTLIPYLNTIENIFLGHEKTNAGFVQFGKMSKTASSLLYDTLGMQFDLKRPVAYLSVAQKQMVEIAKALALNAEILVMDEPSAPLTSHELENLFEVIEVLRKQGVTIIYISHRLEEIFRIADRVTVLKDGRVVGTDDVKNLTKELLIEMMVGRDLSGHYFADKGSGRGKPILSVRNLCQAGRLNGITFDVYEKEIVGIAGLVGSGRSELMRAIFGADKLDSGEIEIDGRIVHIQGPKQAADYGIGFVPEDRKIDGLCLPLEVKVNMTLASLKQISTLGVLNTANEKRVVQDQINRLRVVTPSMNQIVGNLSGGNQQKVVLAKWLVAGCKIIILDEPTRGIDVGAKAEIYHLMRELAEAGAAVIMVSSELPEILGMSDRILVMREGSIAAELSPEQATENLILRYAMGEETLEGNESGGNLE